MTTVSVPTTSQRAAAEMLVADPGRWSPGRSKETGQSFWLVRGSQGRSYFTTSDGCSCPGFRHRGICSHVAACRIRERAEQPVRVVGQPKRDRYSELFPDDQD